MSEAVSEDEAVGVGGVSVAGLFGEGVVVSVTG